MPILNQRFEGRTIEGQRIPAGIGLQRFGPRLPMNIGVHPAVAKSLVASEKNVPAAVQGFGLIDTGASITSVDMAIAEQLQLAPTGTIKLGTAGGPTDAPTFAFSFHLSSMPPIVIPNGVGCDLKGLRIIALIGMDLLSRCILIVNGPDGSFTLSI